MFVKTDLLSVGLRDVGDHVDICVPVVSLDYKVMLFVIVLVILLATVLVMGLFRSFGLQIAID
jgi:hypothetical protein